MLSILATYLGPFGSSGMVKEETTLDHGGTDYTLQAGKEAWLVTYQTGVAQWAGLTT